MKRQSTQPKRRRLPKDHAEYYEWMHEVDGLHGDRRAVFAAGNWAALFDAGRDSLHSGDADKVLVPRWAMLAFVDLLERQLPELKAKAVTGRHSRWNQQYRADLIDWRRFTEVMHRRLGAERRVGWRMDPVDRCLYPDVPTRAELSRKRSAARMRAKRGESGVRPDLVYAVAPNASDDYTAYQAAARLLAKSAYAGSPSAIQKSFERVIDRLSRGEAWRYYIAEWLVFAGHELTDAQHARRR